MAINPAPVPFIAAPARRHFYQSLYVQVITAIVIGVLLGHFWPATGEAMKPLGDVFIELIKMIKMIIAPIIFCTVVVGIAWRTWAPTSQWSAWSCPPATASTWTAPRST